MNIDDLKMNLVPISTGAMAKYEYKPWIEDKFTCTSNFDEKFTLYRISPCKKFIYVPREVCPLGNKDLRVKGHDCGMTSKVVPRGEEQSRIIKESYNYLKQDISHVIKAGTGVGKTVMALDIIAKVNKPTLIIVPKEDLMEQWINEIKKFINMPHSRIGCIQQDICEYRDKWVVVGMLHSVSKQGRYPADLYKHFGLVVLDECDRCPTETLGAALELFPARIKLGLSATPKRKDGKDIAIEAHVGPVLVQSDIANMKYKVIRYTSDWECPKWKVIKNGEVKLVPAKHTASKCGHIINSIIKHKKTNNKIAFLAQASYEKGRQVAVFSDRVQHLEDLYNLIIEKGVPRGEIGFYVGAREINGKKKKISTAEKDRVKTKRVILATYGMLKYGTDIPSIDTLILATPRSDVEQIIGRMLRVYPNKKKPIAFDFDFPDSYVFKNYGIKRLDFYKSKQAEIVFK